METERWPTENTREIPAILFVVDDDDADADDVGIHNALSRTLIYTRIRAYGTNSLNAAAVAAASSSCWRESEGDGYS